MFKYLIVPFLFLFLTSCTISESPEFISVQHFKVDKIKNDSVYIKAKALFKNPNNVGAKCVFEDLQTTINNKKIGVIKGGSFKVKANKNFTVPIDFHFSQKEFLKTNGGLLGLLFSALNEKDITYNVKGKVTFKKFLVKKTMDLNLTDTFNLKDIN